MQEDQFLRVHQSYDEIEAEIHTPSLQRAIDENVIIKMRSHIRDAHSINMTPIFGCLDIVILNNIYYVVDGQHRLKALRDDFLETRIPTKFNVLYYNVSTWEDLEIIFELRNANVPIPDYIKYKGNEYSHLLKDIEHYLRKDYGSIFTYKSSRPYINLTSFLNSLEKSVLIESLNNLEDFKYTLNKENEKVKKLANDNTWCKKNKVTDNMIVISRGCNLYLGLNKNQLWINEPLTKFRISNIFSRK